MRIETLQLMKIRSTLITLLLVLCSAFAPTAVFGAQLIYTWTNSAGGDLATAANWNPNGVPIPGTSSGYVGDVLKFDGQSTGPVLARSTTGSQTGSSVGGTTAGIYIWVTANQASPVNLFTTVNSTASSGIRFNSITNDAGAASLIMGSGTTTNCFDTVWGVSNPESHFMLNNSANPSIINLDMRFRMGGGGAHTFVFGGSGNWYLTNDLVNVNGASTVLTKTNSGTMVWTAGHNTYWTVGGNSETSLGSPINIFGGTLILKSGGLFPTTTTINNNGRCWNSTRWAERKPPTIPSTARARFK